MTEIEEEDKYPVYGGNGLRGYFSKYTNEGEYVLIGRQGALCGNINYASGKFWATEHAVVVYLKPNIDCKWYGEMLRVMNLNQYSVSAAQPGLSVDRIKRLLLPAPPFLEQQAIAHYLDTKTAQIDRKIDLLTQKAQRYEELKRSLINETVTCGLDKSVPMKDSGIDWIGEIPEHWYISHVKRFCKKVTDGAHTSPDLSSPDFPFITVVNLTDGALDFDQCLYTSYSDYKQLVRNGCKPHKFDVLYSKDGTISETVVIDENREFVVGSSFIILRPHPSIVNSKYISYLLSSPIMKYQARLYVKGAGLTRISIFNVSKLFAILPPLNEQKEIAIYLDIKIAKIDGIIKTINAQVQKLQELRKTLINDVVTGKIKVA